MLNVKMAGIVRPMYKFKGRENYIVSIQNFQVSCGKSGILPTSLNVNKDKYSECSMKYVLQYYSTVHWNIILANLF